MQKPQASLRSKRLPLHPGGLFGWSRWGCRRRAMWDIWKIVSLWFFWGKSQSITFMWFSSESVQQTSLCLSQQGEEVERNWANTLFTWLICALLQWSSFVRSTGKGKGKPLQYSCLENFMKSMKRQKDRTLKDELPRLVGAQYATRDQWRNNSERMKRWRQSKNNTQLWMGLVMEVRSDAVKNNIA